MAAENYHLKWDSHLSYLNTSIATLYKNEKFADVVLYSSNNNSNINVDIPTVGISAHKFILSSCSQFFATMFETAPITSPNGVLYIVLPPDLSHRAIQILVQYMYSGEATVSNDILNEVLRGGEILKIRGLCRTSTSSGSSSNNPAGSAHAATSSGHHLGGLASHGHLHQRESSGLYVSNGSRSGLAPPQLPRYSLEHHTHGHHHASQQFRGLGASVMPKDSPVIVKSPKLVGHTGLLSVASKIHVSSAGGISVNKEVAIDPEDKCCYGPGQVESQAAQPQATTSLAAAVAAAAAASALPAPMSICTEVGCNSCPLAAPSTDSSDSQVMRRRNYSDEHEDAVGLVYERRLRRESSACERAHEYFPVEVAPPPSSSSSHFDHVVKPFVSEATTSRLSSPPPPHPHSFLTTIKQEPNDWSNNPPTTTTTTTGNGSSSNTNNNNNDLNNESSSLSPKQPLDFKMSSVKLEANRSTPPEEEAEEQHTLRDYNNFKVLVCEICQKSFEDTKTLVRHLGTQHAGGEPGNLPGGSNSNASSSSGSSSSANTNNNSNNLALRALKTYVPKKRRRVSQQENNVDHVKLLCDLCATAFDTAGEWVRHLSGQHTEVELALFNSKKEFELKSLATRAVHKKYSNAHRCKSAVHKRSAEEENRGPSPEDLQ